jgi:hypothetical protein
VKELRSEIEINASPEKVWELLCDSPGIPEPMRSAIIDRRVGVQLKVKLGTRSGKGATFKMKLISVEPCRELRWKGHLWISGLFDGEHIFETKPLAEERVLFVQREIFGGLFLPFLSGTLNDTKREFEEMNMALKKQAEGV